MKSPGAALGPAFSLDNEGPEDAGPARRHALRLVKNDHRTPVLSHRTAAGRSTPCRSAVSGLPATAVQGVTHVLVRRPTCKNLIYRATIDLLGHFLGPLFLLDQLVQPRGDCQRGCCGGRQASAGGDQHRHSAAGRGGLRCCYGSCGDPSGSGYHDHHDRDEQAPDCNEVALGAGLTWSGHASLPGLTRLLESGARWACCARVVVRGH